MAQQQQQSHYDYSGCPMGRAVAQALDGDSFVDDFDWHFVSPDGLAVKDAWEMATTWALIMQTHVTVRSDHSHYHPVTQFEIAPNYEWVEFWLGCCDPDQADERAMAARASSLVWRALASRLWRPRERSLLEAFVRHAAEAPLRRPGQAISCRDVWDGPSTERGDDLGFFEKNVVFPRFTLRLSDECGGADAMDRLARLFVGLVDHEGDWSVQTAADPHKAGAMDADQQPKRVATSGVGAALGYGALRRTAHPRPH